MTQVQWVGDAMPRGGYKPTSGRLPRSVTDRPLLNRSVATVAR
jgi:hypothetical protein